MTISAYEATNFIQENTKIKEFYDFITQNATDFTYDINAPGRCGWTVLHAACKKGNLELAQAIINMGANINIVRNIDRTPMSEAISGGHLRIVKMLVKNGADIHSENATLLYDYINLASREGKIEIKNYLMNLPSWTLQDRILNKFKYDSDFKINLENSRENFKEKYLKIGDKKNHIKDSVINNNVEQLRILLTDFRNEIKIDLPSTFINMSDSLTRRAVSHNNLEMVKLLIKHGDYSVDNFSIYGKSLAQDAREKGFVEIADYLDDIQEESYQKLLQDANDQQRKITFACSFFHSDLYHQIIQKDNEEKVQIIAQNIAKHMN